MNNGLEIIADNIDSFLGGIAFSACELHFLIFLKTDEFNWKCIRKIDIR